MIDLKTKIKLRLLILGFIFIAGIITSSIDSFSNLCFILIIPGFLLGLALTLPHFDGSKKQLIAVLTLPIFMIILWLISLGIGMFLGIINDSYDDKTGVIILGLISSLLFTVIIDLYYSIRNKLITYSIIIILGVFGSLVGDRLFLTPHDKELNFGKMISIWEILIGLGLTIFAKFDWMYDKVEIEDEDGWK
jgi:hypothetical protein